MALERIDVTGPDAAERREPGLELLQRLGPQAIETPLRVHRGFDEAGVAQHAQVLRHGRLRHAQSPLDVSDRLLGGEQQGENGAAVRLRDDGEDGLHDKDIRLMAYTCQGI